jgi:hypothetical protein
LRNEDVAARPNEPDQPGISETNGNPPGAITSREGEHMDP